MSCNTKTSLAAVIDAVNAQLNNNYVDRDDPRINQGVFTEPTIRGGLMLDEAAKLDFCGYVTECGQREPFGKQWVDRPLYPYNTLVSYEDGGEVKSRWQDIDDVVAGTEIGESYTAYEETRSLGLQGYTIIDSFELGETITQRNQALRHAETGKLYRWAGDLPKVVTADSTPATSGGMGDNAWLEVSDVTLRQELANPDMGAVMIGRGVVAVDSIADLLALPEGQRKADLTYVVSAYYGGWASESPFVGPTGGGEFRYDASRADENNDGTVLDGFVRVVRDATLTPDMYGITTSLDDAEANALRFEKLMASGVPRILFERRYTSSASVVVPASVRILEGVSMYGSGVICTDAGEHVFTIEESSGWVARNIHASHTAKGEGDGFHIQGVNRSFSMYNAIATRCNNGFHFAGVVYVGSLYSCRTNSSNYGFRSTNAAGNSTAFNLEHCYATDISGIGFDFTGCHTINLVQPIMDVNNSTCEGFIRIGVCSVTNISNAHLEGSPKAAGVATGAAIIVSGSTCDIVNIDGFHSDLSCVSENLWYFLFLAFAGNVNVRINGVDATKSSNLGLYRVRNAANNHDRIEISATNRFGTTTTRTRTDVGGQLTVTNPIIRGTATGVNSGARISTGLHGQPENVQLTMRNASTKYATVIPSYDNVWVNGEFSIRFNNIADGTNNTSGVFDVDWQVSRTSS